MNSLLTHLTRRRPLRCESLESRAMLSINPLGGLPLVSGFQDSAGDVAGLNSSGAVAGEVSGSGVGGDVAGDVSAGVDLRALGGLVRNLARDAIQDIGTIVRATDRLAEDATAPLLTALSDSLMAARDTVNDTVGHLFDLLSGNVQTDVNTAINAGPVNASGGATAGISLEPVATLLQSIASNVNDNVGQLQDLAMSLPEDVARPLIRTTLAQVQQVGDRIDEALGHIADQLVNIDVGADVGAGASVDPRVVNDLVRGLLDSAARDVRAIQQFANQTLRNVTDTELVGAVNDRLQELGGTVDSVIDSVFDSVLGVNLGAGGGATAGNDGASGNLDAGGTIDLGDLGSAVPTLIDRLADDATHDLIAVQDAVTSLAGDLDGRLLRGVNRELRQVDRLVDRAIDGLFADATSILDSVLPGNNVNSIARTALRGLPV